MGTTRRAWAVAALFCCGVASSTAVSAWHPDCFPDDTGAAFAGDKDKDKKDGEKQKDAKKSVDAADVYFGDARKWEKPAEIDADKVYAKIDEYRQIVDGGLKPGDAKYEILMAKASKRFCAAVKKTAKDGEYDLVAKIGAVKGVASVPDITSDVIAAL